MSVVKYEKNSLNGNVEIIKVSIFALWNGY